MYKRQQQRSTDLEVKQYLTDKIKQAQFVIQAVEQRRSTLLDLSLIHISYGEAGDFAYSVGAGVLTGPHVCGTFLVIGGRMRTSAPTV